MVQKATGVSLRLCSGSFRVPWPSERGAVDNWLLSIDHAPAIGKKSVKKSII